MFGSVTVGTTAGGSQRGGSSSGVVGRVEAHAQSSCDAGGLEVGVCHCCVSSGPVALPV